MDRREVPHHRREEHLLSGLGVQILIVGLLVFAYTQAIRQVKHQRELFQRLQEQLTMAREQVSRQGPTPDLSVVRAQIQKVRPDFLIPEEMAPQMERIRALAERSLQLTETRWKKSDDPTDSVAISIPGRDDFEVDLHELEMEGTGPARSAAALLAGVGSSSGGPLLPLEAVEMKLNPSDTGPAVRFSFRWLMPVIAPGLEDKEPIQRKPLAVMEPAWGPREEPFLSPLDHPGALRVPAEKNASLRLTGILWDPAHPACVINGQVLRPGEKAGEYLVVLITRTAVVLQGLDQELVLHLQ